MSSVADTKTREPGDFSSSSRKWRLPPLPQYSAVQYHRRCCVWAALPPLSLRSAMLRSPAPLRPPEPFSYEVAIGERRCQVPVKGAVPVETRIPVRVAEDGALTLRFSADKREWRLCGLSATWLCGLADMNADVSTVEAFAQ